MRTIKLIRKAVLLFFIVVISKISFGQETIIIDLTKFEVPPESKIQVKLFSQTKEYLVSDKKPVIKISEEINIVPKEETLYLFLIVNNQTYYLELETFDNVKRIEFQSRKNGLIKKSGKFLGLKFKKKMCSFTLTYKNGMSAVGALKKVIW